MCMKNEFKKNRFFSVAGESEFTLTTKHFNPSPPKQNVTVIFSNLLCTKSFLSKREMKKKIK